MKDNPKRKRRKYSCNSSDFQTDGEVGRDVLTHAHMRGPRVDFAACSDEKERKRGSRGIAIRHLYRRSRSQAYCRGMGIVRERAALHAAGGRRDVGGCRMTGVGNRLLPYLRAPRLTSFLSIQPLK